MEKARIELIGDSYIKKAEAMVVWPNGGGKNDKHWHKSVTQVATWLWHLDNIEQKRKDIKSNPYPNCGDQLAQLEKDHKHVRRLLDARGTADAIRGKGSSAKKR